MATASRRGRLNLSALLLAASLLVCAVPVSAQPPLPTNTPSATTPLVAPPVANKPSATTPPVAPPVANKPSATTSPVAPPVANEPQAPATPAASPLPESAQTAKGVVPPPKGTAAATPSSAALGDPGLEPLHMATKSDRQALSEWKRHGVIGQSTFFDKFRKVTWLLAFMCFLVWLVGKFAGKATMQRFGLPGGHDSSSLIEVLEKKRLSPGRSIMMLRVGPKVLAVAVTESGYTTLTEIDGEALKQHQDASSAEVAELAQIAPVPNVGPAEIARHYLSIIPGLGAKK